MNVYLAHKSGCHNKNTPFFMGFCDKESNSFMILTDGNSKQEHLERKTHPKQHSNDKSRHYSTLLKIKESTLDPCANSKRLYLHMQPAPTVLQNKHTKSHGTGN